MDLIRPWTKTTPRPRFHVSLSLADDVQRTEQFLDHAIYLSPVQAYEVGYPDAAVDRLKQALQARRPLAAITATWRLLRSPRSAWKVAQRWRYRAGGGPVAHYRVSMYVEQAPNPDSRLTLATERDALGMPKLQINWQLGQLDRTSFERLLASLSERLERAGIGTLDLGPEQPTLDDWVDAAHHIGATRMAASPREGVVDRECRVFGTDNLYIASSSVFPTGHSAAPTMTILALARRLGDHLLSLHASNRPVDPSRPAGHGTP